MHRASTIRYNYTDHQSIPEDHQRHEIVDGELFVMPTPRFSHQNVAANLLVLLRSFADSLQLGSAVGPITVRLEDELVLEPDLVFIRQDRMSIVVPEGHVHAPPRPRGGDPVAEHEELRPDPQAQALYRERRAGSMDHRHRRADGGGLAPGVGGARADPGGPALGVSTTWFSGSHCSRCSGGCRPRPV